MSEQTPNSNPEYANLVSFILVINFVIIAGLIFTNTPIQADKGNRVILAVSTAIPSDTPTPLPTNTAVPTELPLPTLTPTVISTEAPTAEVVTEIAQTNQSNSATSYDPSLISKGEQLFLTCSACHGPDARGLPNLGKNLIESEFVHSLTDNDLLNFVKTGRPIWDPLNTTGIDMPPKGGNPAFSDEDILAIIAYIRTISASS